MKSIADTTIRGKPWMEPGSPRHDKLMIKAVSDPGINQILEQFAEKDKVSIDELKALRYEVEVVLKRENGFIIGYADAIIKFGDILYLVEVKPAIDSIGDTIRQMKTYKDTLREMRLTRYDINFNILRMFLVTYDNPAKPIRDFFEHEGIRVVTFAEDERSD